MATTGTLIGKINGALVSSEPVRNERLKPVRSNYIQSLILKDSQTIHVALERLREQSSLIASFFRSSRVVRQSNVFTKLQATDHIKFLRCMTQQTASKPKWVETSFGNWKREFIHASPNLQVDIIRQANEEYLSILPKSVYRSLLSHHLDLLDDKTARRLALQLPLGVLAEIFHSHSGVSCKRFVEICRSFVSTSHSCCNPLETLFIACCHPTVESLCIYNKRDFFHRVALCSSDELIFEALSTYSDEELISHIERLHLACAQRIIDIFAKNKPQIILHWISLAQPHLPCFGLIFRHLPPPSQRHLLDDEYLRLNKKEIANSLRFLSDEQLVSFVGIDPLRAEPETVAAQIPHLHETKIIAMALAAPFDFLVQRHLMDFSQESLSLIARTCPRAKQLQALLDQAKARFEVSTFLALARAINGPIKPRDLQNQALEFLVSMSQRFVDHINSTECHVNAFFNTTSDAEELKSLCVEDLQELWNKANSYARDFFEQMNCFRFCTDSTQSLFLPKRVRHFLFKRIQKISPEAQKVSELCKSLFTRGSAIYKEHLGRLNNQTSPAEQPVMRWLTSNVAQEVADSEQSFGAAILNIYNNLRDSLDTIGVTGSVLGSLGYSYEDVLERGLRATNLADYGIKSRLDFEQFMST